MSARAYLLGWIALTAVLVPVAASAAPLQHDVFARPFQLGAAPAAGANTFRKPKLTAVIVAGKKSLVNLNGTIIGIGEQKDGYRLISVGDRKAIFEKRKKLVVLEMSSLKPGKEKGN